MYLMKKENRPPDRMSHFIASNDIPSYAITQQGFFDNALS